MEKKLTRIFCYGTLKDGFGNHYLLKDQVFVGTAVTLEKYTMRSLGGFPAVSINEETSPISGEIYEVDEEALQRVHQLEGYPGWYGLAEVETTNGPAYMYHMDTTGPIVEDGRWR